MIYEWYILSIMKSPNSTVIAFASSLPLNPPLPFSYCLLLTCLTALEIAYRRLFFLLVLQMGLSQCEQHFFILVSSESCKNWFTLGIIALHLQMIHINTILFRFFYINWDVILYSFVGALHLNFPILLKVNLVHGLICSFLIEDLCCRCA